MRRRSTRILAAVAAAAAAPIVALSGGSAAQAGTIWPSHSSYTHNYNYSYSELRDRTAGNVIANLYNNTTVYMRCYTDAQSAYGNYWSNRWFYVTTTGGGSGWITSSYVYNQAVVPPC